MLLSVLFFFDCDLYWWLLTVISLSVILVSICRLCILYCYFSIEMQWPTLLSAVFNLYIVIVCSEGVHIWPWWYSLLMMMYWWCIDTSFSISVKWYNHWWLIGNHPMKVLRYCALSYSEIHSVVLCYSLWHSVPFILNLFGIHCHSGIHWWYSTSFDILSVFICYWYRYSRGLLLWLMMVQSPYPFSPALCVPPSFCLLQCYSR